MRRSEKTSTLKILAASLNAYEKESHPIKSHTASQNSVRRKKKKWPNYAAK